MTLRIGMLALLFAAQALPDSEQEGKGFTVWGRFQGSANTIGLVSRLDGAAGYNFNRYLGVDGGVPVYFVRPSSDTSSALGTTARSGIGNVFGDVRLSIANPLVNYTSVLTGTAPTGDKDRGFSTGRPTIDWVNHFDRSFSRLTPFANIGLANTISDTPFFIRPFSSLGFVSQLEGGADYRIVRGVSVGGSAHKITPSGKQTVISRVVAAPRGASSGRGSSRGDGNRHGHEQPFETTFETVGTSDLARDHGFSGWVNLRPASYVSFEVGYSRSVPFALDTLFFGTSFNLRPLAHRIHGH